MPLDAAAWPATVSASWRQSVPEKTAVAFSTPADGWDKVVAERLVRLRLFRSGWDGHQARPISRTVVDYACSLLPQIMVMSPGVPVPFIAPLPSGGLQLEWHRNGWDLEIEIAGPGELYIYSRELATD